MPKTVTARGARQQLPGSPAARVRLKVLGAFSLLDQRGEDVAVSTRKNRALLAILALQPGHAMSREAVCALLWGDHGDDRARSSLRQSLAVLRKELGAAAPILMTEDGAVAFDMSAIEVDAIVLLSSGTSDDAEHLVRAIQQFGGELLADLDLKSESFEEWLVFQRSRIKDHLIRLLEALCPMCGGEERILFARRLVALDTLRESSHRALMEAYAAAGENALALKQFAECASLLHSELGVYPGQQTQSLRDTIARTSSSPPAPTGNKDRMDAPSVAVLPFANLSDDPSQHLLADGLAEDIITGLSRFRHLGVVARNASFRLRGEFDAVGAGVTLAAGFIVEGSVRRIGARVRITTQLVETGKGRHVWADAFDVPLADIFDVQDQVVQKIVATLCGRVTDASARHAKLKQPGSLEAYELVFRANAMNWETRESKVEGRKLLEHALALDPGYATAHALLAAITLRTAAYHAHFTPDVLDEALHHARLAVDHDANDSACHSILGWVLMARSDFALAETHISCALALNPNNVYAMVNRGSLLTATGRPEEAMFWIRQAIASDPFFNPSWCGEKLGLACFMAKRDGDAAEHLARTPILRFHMSAVLAAAQHRLGRLPQAHEALARALRVRPDCDVDMVLSLLPFEKSEDRQYLKRALTDAGLPHRSTLPSVQEPGGR